MSTERQVPVPNSERFSQYLSDFKPRIRKEKATYTPKQKAKYQSRREQRRTAPETISQRLAEIFAMAPPGALPNNGMPEDIASCYQNVATPWNAFIRCEVRDEDLQLALAAMLGSDIWAEALTEALAEAARGHKMTIKEFLRHTFELAAAAQANLRTSQDWQGLFTSDKLMKRRKDRASKRSRSRSRSQSPQYGLAPFSA